MKKTLIFFIIIARLANIHAQQHKIDSLKNRYAQTREPFQKLQILLNVCEKIKYNGDQKKEELKYYNELLSLAQKLSNDSIENLSYRFLSGYYLKAEDLKKAEKFALLSQKNSIEHHNNRDLLKAYTQLGRIYNHFDIYDKAIEAYIKAISIYQDSLSSKDQKTEERMLSIIYTNLATTYKNKHQDSLAIIYELKAVDWATRTKDYMRISLFYTKVGWTYYVLEQYALAEKNFKSALKDSNKIYVEAYNISAREGLAFTYRKWKKYEKALYYDSVCLDFYNKTNNNFKIQFISNHLANIYLETDNLPKAVEYNNQSRKIAEKINHLRSIGNVYITEARINLAQNRYPEAKEKLLKIIHSDIQHKLSKTERLDLYDLLIKIAEIEENHKDLLTYMKLQKEVNDSLTAFKLANISRLDLKYQIEKNNKKLAEQQQELSTKEAVKQKWKGSTVIAGLIALIVLLLLIKYYLNYKKNKKELEKTIAEIDKIKKELMKQNHLPLEKTEFDLEKFHQFLMKKYHIKRFELIDVWINIAQGKNRTEYIKENHYNENTVKAWLKELYKQLKTYSIEKPEPKKFSNIHAVKEYYQSLLLYQTYIKKSQ